MRGVVTLYSRQLQFLFEDCATVLAHLTTISSEEYCGRRGCNLLISRRKQPKALSRRVDFNHLELEEDIIHIQSGEECMRSDLNAFVVMDTFSDHELSPRGSLLYSGELEGEDHGNFQRSASIDQYEQASGRDHSDRIICESNKNEIKLIQRKSHCAALFNGYNHKSIEDSGTIVRAKNYSEIY